MNPATCRTGGLRQLPSRRHRALARGNGDASSAKPRDGQGHNVKAGRLGPTPLGDRNREAAGAEGRAVPSEGETRQGQAKGKKENPRSTVTNRASLSRLEAEPVTLETRCSRYRCRARGAQPTIVRRRPTRFPRSHRQYGPTSRRQRDAQPTAKSKSYRSPRGSKDVLAQPKTRQRRAPDEPSRAAGRKSPKADLVREASSDCTDRRRTNATLRRDARRNTTTSAARALQSAATRRTVAEARSARAKAAAPRKRRPARR